MDAEEAVRLLKTLNFPNVVDFQSPTGRAILAAAEGLARNMNLSSSSGEAVAMAAVQPGALLAAAAQVQRASDDTRVTAALAQFMDPKATKTT